MKLELVRTDGGTQSRAALDEGTVADYAEQLSNGVAFPAVIVFRDADGQHWLADGFHRVQAARRAGLEEVAADVRDGTKRDALLYSVGANATHGLRRTNADKRHAVMTMLGDSEWAKWSDRQIAKACGVTHPFVAKLRGGEVVTVTTPASPFKAGILYEAVDEKWKYDRPVSLVARVVAAETPQDSQYTYFWVSIMWLDHEDDNGGWVEWTRRPIRGDAVQLFLDLQDFHSRRWMESEMAPSLNVPWPECRTFRRHH